MGRTYAQPLSELHWETYGDPRSKPKRGSCVNEKTMSENNSPKRGAPAFGSVAAERQIVERIHELRRERHTFHTIAQYLNRSGSLSKRGRWHPTTVRRVLLRTGFKLGAEMEAASDSPM
jgi:hypothetical protein